MKKFRLLALLCLVIGIIGCDHNIAPTSTKSASSSITPTIERNSTATLRPTNTTTLPAQIVDSIDPTVTPTSLPPTPVPAPLSKNGPWMLLSKGTYYTGPTPYIDPVLINTDGSAWEPLNLPRPQWASPGDATWYYMDPAPTGPYIAARGYLEEYSLNCDEHAQPNEIDPYEDVLYIIKLPENQPILEIQLHGFNALAQAQKEDCNLHDGEIPPVIGVTSLQVNGFWSPDHRYLVFSAAPEGPAADLYLFDRQTETIRRLTTRQNNPKVLGWSPDGQSIVYMGVSRMVDYHSWVSESSGLYVVSLSGTDHFLLKPKYVPGWLEWLSSSEFIIKDGLCDPADFGTKACNVNLVIGDISTGRYQTIYQDIHKWISYAADPIQHILLFDSLPIEMLGGAAGQETPTPSPNGTVSEFAEGVYQYDFQSHSFHLVPLDEPPSFIFWDRTYQALRYDKSDSESPFTSRTYLIRYEPDHGFRTEKITASPYTSPDGKWQIGKVGEDTYILNSSLQPVQRLSSDWGEWAPDSSAFVQIVENTALAETQLIFYLKQNNWQNPFTRHLKEGFGWWGGWIIQ